MTAKPISVTTLAVPKDKLDDKTLVRFTAGTLDRIDAVAGKNRRAKWIREVVERELKRCERQKTGKAADGEQG